MKQWYFFLCTLLYTTVANQYSDLIKTRNNMPSPYIKMHRYPWIGLKFLWLGTLKFEILKWILSISCNTFCQNVQVTFKFLVKANCCISVVSGFSLNLLAFCRECRPLIGCARAHNLILIFSLNFTSSSFVIRVNLLNP